MLTAVPNKINEAVRLVTLRHPNSMPCIVFRKNTLRVDAPPGSMGGHPTLGGMGVLTSEDEDNYEWTLLGSGKILFTGGFGGTTVVDRNDAVKIQNTATATIELFDVPAEPGLGVIDGHTVPRQVCNKHDVVYAFPGLVVERTDVVYVIPAAEANLPYEVVSVESALNVPPYTRTYQLNARDDLDYLQDETSAPNDP